MKNNKKELGLKKEVKPQSKLGAYMNNNNNNQKLSCGCKKGACGCHQGGKCQCSADKGKGGDILPCGCKKGSCGCKEGKPCVC